MKYIIAVMVFLASSPAIACPKGRDTDTISLVYRDIHDYVKLEARHPCGHRYVIQREVSHDQYLSLEEGMGFTVIEEVELAVTEGESATYLILSKFAESQWYYRRPVRGELRTFETYTSCATGIMRAARARSRRVTMRDEGVRRLIEID